MPPRRIRSIDIARHYAATVGLEAAGVAAFDQLTAPLSECYEALGAPLPWSEDQLAAACVVLDAAHRYIDNGVPPDVAIGLLRRHLAEQ